MEWFGSGTDITEQKSGEEASRWLSAIIQTSPHGIISKSLDGVITSWNPAAERIFGYTEAEAVGQPITMIIPLDHREEGRQILDRLRGGEVIEKLETIRLRKDGSRVQVSLTISPLAQSSLRRNEAADVRATPRVVEFVEDITRSKETEEALRKSENELRALAGSLLSAQEDERRRIARDLHDDVTQDLALIAIELGKLAANSGGVDALHLALRALQARVTDVSQVVRHLSHGLHPSMLEDFGLAAALEVFCEEFGNVEGMPVDFQSDADESGLTVLAAACLYRVAQEAIRNAWKHAHASHVRVELSNDGDLIRLAIRDDGIGIGGARPERWECGLGLVSMKERMRLLHGELVVQSSPGHGTDIIASIPARLIGGGVSEDSAG
jgi:PAS domain S-box-containing protein